MRKILPLCAFFMLAPQVAGAETAMRFFPVNDAPRALKVAQVRPAAARQDGFFPLDKKIAARDARPAPRVSEPPSALQAAQILDIFGNDATAH